MVELSILFIDMQNGIRGGSQSWCRWRRTPGTWNCRIEGLHIADTSVFPDIISTHTVTMAGAVVVAEKCAQMILQRD